MTGGFFTVHTRAINGVSAATGDRDCPLLQPSGRNCPLHSLSALFISVTVLQKKLAESETELQTLETAVQVSVAALAAAVVTSQKQRFLRMK